MDESRHPLVLLADDQEDQALLMQLALEQLGAPARLEVVHDGMECLEYLRGEGAHAGATPPDLLLLDVNMPKMNGFETLAAIRSDERLAGLPVVALSTSSDPRDVDKMYEIGADSYLIKPMDFDRFVDLMRNVLSSWLHGASSSRAKP